MKAIIRMSEVLHAKYGFFVPLKEIGYESHLFYLDEVDENLVKKDLIEHLEEPFATESANYTDVEGNYYIVIQIETGAVDPYEVWLVNGEVVKDFTEGME